MLDEESLQAVDIFRQPVDEALDLVEQQRHQKHEREHEREDEQHEDQERRAEPPDAHPLEAVGERVEEIGEREPGHERQQDAAKDVERGDGEDERGEPERDLSLGHHRRRSAVLQAAMWRSHPAR